MLSGGDGRRRNWSAGENMAMLRESLGPEVSVLLVALRHGVNPNQLFHFSLAQALPNVKPYVGGSRRAGSAGLVTRCGAAQDRRSGASA